MKDSYLIAQELDGCASNLAQIIPLLGLDNELQSLLKRMQGNLGLLSICMTGSKNDNDEKKLINNIQEDCQSILKFNSHGYRRCHEIATNLSKIFKKYHEEKNTPITTAESANAIVSMFNNCARLFLYEHGEFPSNKITDRVVDLSPNPKHTRGESK